MTPSMNGNSIKAAAALGRMGFLNSIDTKE
jgi:hypothetical protein